MDIEQLLKDFEPLLLKLSRYPFQTGKAVHVKKRHTEHLYEELRVRFVELCYEYDESKGTPFPGYIKGRLQWFAHHIIERLKNEDEYMVLVDPIVIDEMFEQKVEDEIDFSDEISFEMEGYINKLPKRQKQVLLDHFVHGLDLKFIAEKLGVNITNVYEYKRLGVERLKEMHTKKDEQ